MTPGFAKSRAELPWLPYGKCNRVIINAHNFPAATGWTPANISTALWLDANTATSLYDANTGGSLVASGTRVGRWEDLSGNARNATQATSGSRPQYLASQIGGLPGVVCDNVAMRFMNLPNFTSGFTDASIFVVTNPSEATGSFGLNGAPFRFGSSSATNHFGSTTTDKWYCSFGITTRPLFSNTIPAIGANTVVGIVKSSGTVTPYLDGVSRIVSSGTTNGWSTTPTIGQNVFTYPYRGIIGEVVMISSAADTTTRQKIEGYLAWKWGTVSALDASHPYKSAAP